MPFTVSILLNLNKSIILYHSKQYGPFIDFCRSLVRSSGKTVDIDNPNAFKI